MKLALHNNKDVLTGVLLVFIGVLAVVGARGFPMGSAMRMGPGYFPTILGGVLCLFGVYLLVRGIRTTRPASQAPLLKEDSSLPPRPLTRPPLLTTPPASQAPLLREDSSLPPRPLTRPPLLKEEGMGEWAWKPLILITLAIVLFGFMVGRFGLIPALAVMFFTSALGGREFRFKEVLVLTVLMSIFAVGVFIYG